MSAQTTTDPPQSTTTGYSPQRPYQDYPLGDLYEMLEHDYDRGRPFNEHIVWELVHRAAKAEEL
ncbi:MAG: hypothetical protein ACRDTT_21135 [Pseudonocardiaceae bacterium]